MFLVIYTLRAFGWDFACLTAVRLYFLRVVSLADQIFWIINRQYLTGVKLASQFLAFHILSQVLPCSRY